MQGLGHKRNPNQQAQHAGGGQAQCHGFLGMGGFRLGTQEYAQNPDQAHGGQGRAQCQHERNPPVDGGDELPCDPEVAEATGQGESDQAQRAEQIQGHVPRQAVAQTGPLKVSADAADVQLGQTGQAAHGADDADKEQSQDCAPDASYGQRHNQQDHAPVQH